MRTETTTRTLYKFDELAEDAQNSAIEELYNINVDYEWWDAVYEDAAQIGLKINEFDIGRGSFCKGKLTLSAVEVANKIINDHGKQGETYETARSYLVDLSELKREYAEKGEDYDDLDTEDIDANFLRSLLEDYLLMLRKEYEYMTSTEAIRETINANEYEFTEEGKLA